MTELTRIINSDISYIRLDGRGDSVILYIIWIYFIEAATCYLNSPINTQK